MRSGTPPDAVASLLDAAKAAHADPQVRARLEAQGFDVPGSSSPHLMADIKQQIERWARIVKATGLPSSGSEAHGETVNPAGSWNFFMAFKGSSEAWASFG